MVDPRGERWTVSREWFGLPGWARDQSSPLEHGGLDLPLVIGDFDDDSGILTTLVIAVAILTLLVVLVLLFVPLVVLLLAVLVAVLAVGARLLSITAWTVRAQGATQTLTWRAEEPAIARNGRSSCA
jgi:hypothetical protein